MILINPQHMPGPEEIVGLAIGNNCEPVLVTVKEDGGYETIDLRDYGTVSEEGEEFFNLALGYAEAQKGFSVRSRHFSNDGNYDPDFGVGYWNVNGVLTQGIIWAKDATAEEVSNFLGEESSEEAVRRLLELFQMERCEAVSIWTGPASALLSQEEMLHWTDRPRGSGFPQKSILRRMLLGDGAFGSRYMGHGCPTHFSTSLWGGKWFSSDKPEEIVALLREEGCV
ncbi:MAG: hypothetical protein PHF35_02990 [Candidatus Moranbacteria bacterium]|nr:hypothetical protein [Candidatus Moranbacteria bacterium]